MDDQIETREFFDWAPSCSFTQNLKYDWSANRDSSKGRLVMILFRLASRIRRGKFLRWLGYPYLVIYRVCVEWILGIEIPPLTRIGMRFAVHHGQGIVVNNRVIIGDDCLIRQGVTLGNRSEGDPYGCPVIGNNVVIGANALVLGRLTVGDGAVIGAGAVVTHNVDSEDIVVGNPARSIK